MAVIQVNAFRPAPDRLWQLAQELPPGAPIIVMIHGYRFCPDSPAHDPHRHILSLTPATRARRVRSWPASLGLTESGPEGLGIAFGWPARGRLREVYHRAADAGADLARVVAEISARANRPVQLIGHSLGARVALQAMESCKAGEIGRIIVMAGAELRDAAEAALESPAAHYAEIINVTSRENDLFDLALELGVGLGRRPALGFGLSEPRRNWVDLQIDSPDTRSALAGLGFEIGADLARACHWSPYLRDGLFDFYRVTLSQPWALPLPLLRANLPTAQSPRWSRLFQLPRPQAVFRAAS